MSSKPMHAPAGGDGPAPVIPTDGRARSGFRPGHAIVIVLGLVVAIAVLAVLLGLTGFGVYTAFGPPSKGLTDPFDDHDD